jgi:hypothetical protein
MRFTTTLLISVFTVLFTLNALADCGTLPACVGDPGEVPGSNCCTDVTVPFDGGVSLLIAAGLGIGGMSIFKKKKTVE